MPKFEVFQKRMSKPSDKPYVSIQKGGGLSMNKAAHMALGEPEAIELMFDRDDQIFGMRPVEPDEPHAYPLRPTSAKRDSTYLASGTAFTKYYDIDTTISRRWLAYLDEGVLCVDLKTEATEVIGNRRPATRIDNDIVEPLPLRGVH